MTKIELQSQIQRKAQELPDDLLQEVFDYMEFILDKRNRRNPLQDTSLESWWNKIGNFSGDFLTDRTQPPLDKAENLFE